LSETRGSAPAAVGLWSLWLICAPALAQDAGRPLLEFKRIYDEVKEMGARPGADFIQWEFFIGAPDDDDTNKTISVIVFIQSAGGIETMKVQVTYMEKTPENPKVKLAKQTKSIQMTVGPEGIRAGRSDFDERELPRLAEDILKSVRDKKRLLGIIKSGPA